jgi:hypothetical protein
VGLVVSGVSVSPASFDTISCSIFMIIAFQLEAVLSSGDILIHLKTIRTVMMMMMMMIMIM